MLDTFATALSDLLAWQHMAYMMFGIFVGLAVGILPGLGGIAGMSLLIPFIFGMNQTSALAMLVGMVAVIPTGDTFTSVLMGIPGSSASQATILDGYPLAKQGQAARALSAAFSASLLGGIFGAIVLTGFVVVAKPVILAFGTAELFMLAVLGLSVVGVLAGHSISRGIATCGLGLMVGAIGVAPSTGEPRFDLEITYLQDGIPLAIVGLGLFAIPEISDLMRRNQAIARDSGLGAGWLQGVVDTFRSWFLVLRCSTLGTIVGAIPGLGGGVVDWVAYAHVVQTSRDQTKFGRGDIRGVIAPEAANNSLQGGALMPTILFGIPGSGSMAIFLGGLALISITPGPSMVTTDLHLTYTIAWSLALASVIGAAICFLLAAPISRLTLIPFNLIAPFMIMVVCFAAFQARRDLLDLLLMFVLGLVGIFLRRFGWPRPAFLIGFVLSDQAENYLHQALQFYGWGFVTRPGVIIIAILAVISILLALRGRISEQGFVSGSTTGVVTAGQAPARPPVKNRAPQITFLLAMIALVAYGFIDSFSVTFTAAVFPASMAVVTLFFMMVLLCLLAFGKAEGGVNYDEELQNSDVPDEEQSGIWQSVAWFAGLFTAAALVGFIIAISVFIPLFLIVRARLGIVGAVVYAAICIGFMILVGYLLTLDFPAGLLQQYVDLPWPLR
ncbi:MAG: tripartite tricarboxylate transporter permease [Hyphomicrobiaceae bacterium]